MSRRIHRRNGPVLISSVTEDQLKDAELFKKRPTLGRRQRPPRTHCRWSSWSERVSDIPTRSAIHWRRISVSRYRVPTSLKRGVGC